MRRAWALIFLLMLFPPAMRAGAYTCQAPLCKDAVAAHAYFTQAMAAGRCFAVDIMHGTAGTLLTGSSDDVLPAGRYRLHVPLAMAPLGDLNVSFIAITLTVGDAKRTVTMLHFPVADEFIDLPLDFTAPGGTIIHFSITWSLDSEQAKKNRIRALNPDIGPDAGETDTDIESEAPREAQDGTISRKELSKIPDHLAACALAFEALCPVQISAITTDKITYRPDEGGTASVTLKNCTAEPVSATLTVELVSGLDTHTQLYNAALEIPPGESKSWSGPFATKMLHWGAELRATVQVAKMTDTARYVFAVSDNFWETALVTGMGYTYSFHDAQIAERWAAGARAEGFTALEGVFWAPDDFGDFTPKDEIFFGGQATYYGSASGTKNVIAAAHKHGLAATVYSNLWGGDGKPSFEMMRKHPDWFGGADYSSDWLEQWPLMEQRKIGPTCLWPLTWLNTDNSEAALHVHAAELIASHQQFGWDGVRYDSYGSSAWTKMATALVRKLVQAEVPNYRWGYNTSIPTDEKLQALDIMVGGGGLTMEEGIRATGKQSASFAAYFNTVLSYRDIVWPHGGHLGVCYDRARGRKTGTLLDDLYLSTFLAAGGAHPYYSALENELGQYPRFALRYAEFLYDNRLRPLKAPESVVHFAGDPRLMEWKRLARARDLGGEHRRLILHLLNPPVDDMSLHNLGMKCPPPLRGLPVSVTLPDGAKVDALWNLCPIPDAGQQSLKYEINVKGELTFTVPEVRFWNVIVIDYRAGVPLQ